MQPSAPATRTARRVSSAASAAIAAIALAAPVTARADGPPRDGAPSAPDGAREGSAADTGGDTPSDTRDTAAGDTAPAGAPVRASGSVAAGGSEGDDEDDDEDDDESADPELAWLRAVLREREQAAERARAAARVARVESARWHLAFYAGAAAGAGNALGDGFRLAALRPWAPRVLLALGVGRGLGALFELEGRLSTSIGPTATPVAVFDAREANLSASCPADTRYIQQADNDSAHTHDVALELLGRIRTAPRSPLYIAVGVTAGLHVVDVRVQHAGACFDPIAQQEVAAPRVEFRSNGVVPYVGAVHEIGVQFGPGARLRAAVRATLSYPLTAEFGALLGVAAF